MQKVVGSNPISRLDTIPLHGGRLALAEETADSGPQPIDRVRGRKVYPALALGGGALVA